MSNKKYKGDVKALSFSNITIPLPTESGKGNRKGGDVMQYYGNDNVYPNFLLKLYTESPIHKGIVNSKVDYIIGDTIIYKDSNVEADYKVNKDENVQELLRKVIKDFVLFNYYAIEIIYNGFGEAIEFNHIPAQNIRTNKNHNKFWFSDDWFGNNNKVIEFEGWTPKAINEDYSSKIFFYSSYTPSINNTYPTPDYSGAIKSVQTDIDIRDFHSNNINNNFSASSIITFFNGEPTDEIKENIENTITKSYTGTSGKKLIINFANEDSKGAEVTNISASDWNDAFMTLKENTINDIIVGHSLTSPLLAGISISGQLGANSELETAYTIFKNLYVVNKRNEILKSINTLFAGVFEEIDIKDNGELFKKQLDSNVLSQIMTIDELRKIEGLAPLPNNTGNRLLNDIPLVTAPQIGTPKQEFSTDEDEIKFNSIAHLGLNKDDYIHLRKHYFNDANIERLTNYIIENTPFAGKSLSSIKEDLGDDYSIQILREEIAKLVVAKVIPMTQLIDTNDLRKATKDLNVNTTSTSSNINRIEIMYSYEGPSDFKNRAFCSKLVNANKFYTREEIQTMSTILGYDIYIHCGGKNCRHQWQKHTVVRKGEDKNG